MTTSHPALAATAAEHAANAALAEILFSPEGLVDPYSRYNRLREAAPVHRSTLGTWVLTRHRDVDEFLRNKNVDKNVHTWMAGRFSGEWDQHQALRKLAANMLWANPPEHTRLRRIVNRSFTPQRVLEHRAFIERRFDELITPLADAGGGDVCNDVFFPLALGVVAGLVGAHQEDGPQLREWIRDFQRVFEVGMTASELRAADAAAMSLDDYFGDLVRQRQRRRGDDLVSALLDTEDEDRQLEFDELVQMCHMLIAAGSETTTFFLTNGVRLFAEHPDQAELVRADPALLSGAIDEVLRYAPAAHMIPRTTNAPVRVGDITIPQGSRVMVMIAAANRDPAQFPDPDRFDVTRKDSPVMSYGLGTHFCLGWRLANLQAQVVFSTMFERYSLPELAEPVRPRTRVAFPQIEALRVTFARRDAGKVAMRFLSPAYLERLAMLAPPEQPAIPHVNLRLQFRATGTPEGTVDHYFVVERGIIARAGCGLLEDGDLTITASYRDLIDFHAGDLHAATAFVTGQFAVTGDRARLLDLMVMLQSGRFHDFVAGLWANTVR